MTEKQKMIAGELYNASDPELIGNANAQQKTPTVQITFSELFDSVKFFKKKQNFC